MFYSIVSGSYGISRNSACPCATLSSLLILLVVPMMQYCPSHHSVVYVHLRDENRAWQLVCSVAFSRLFSSIFSIYLFSSLFCLLLINFPHYCITRFSVQNRRNASTRKVIVVFDTAKWSKLASVALGVSCSTNIIAKNFAKTYVHAHKIFSKKSDGSIQQDSEPRCSLVLFSVDSFILLENVQGQIPKHHR